VFTNDLKLTTIVCIAKLQLDREYGIIYAAPVSPGGPPQDIAMMVVSNGWAKVREAGGEGEDAVRSVADLNTYGEPALT
jgi:hypothetical protein